MIPPAPPPRKQRGFILDPYRFAAAPPPPPAGKIILPLTGTNGSTSYPDTGTLGLTWTGHGNAVIDTSINGTGDLKLDGTGDYLSATWPGSTPLSGDFSIKFKFWKSANGHNAFDVAIGTDTSASGTSGWFIEMSSSRGFVFVGNGSVNVIRSLSPNCNDSTIHQAEVNRVGSLISLLYDGVSVATTTSSASFTTTSGIIAVGTLVFSGSPFYDFNGHIWDVIVDF